MRRIKSAAAECPGPKMYDQALTVRCLARGPDVEIYQIIAAPPQTIRVGQIVQLVRRNKAYTGVTRRITAMRVPDKGCVDLVLKDEEGEVPTILLNTAIRPAWVELPEWADAIYRTFKDALPDVFPQPPTVTAPWTGMDPGPHLEQSPSKDPLGSSSSK